MPFTIFYSWQMKTDRKYNFSFIKECLETAIKELKKELHDDTQELYLDRDTQGITGIPNIPTTIEKKIKMCDIFVADLTFTEPLIISISPPKRTILDRLLFRPKLPPTIIEKQEGTPATNVVWETGYAGGSEVTEGRIITVLNEAYGPATKFPFDLVQRRFPVNYFYNASTSPEQKKDVKIRLVKELKKIIASIYKTEHERQKERFKPFETWKTWEQTITIPFDFERTNYITGVFETLRSVINTPRTVFRFCGLPGIGKTRLLFECFKEQGMDARGDLTGKILYVDTKERGDGVTAETVKRLLQQGEDKILIVDNCTQDQHEDLARFVTHQNSQLKLVTVSSNPEERSQDFNSEHQTRLIVLQSIEYKETVSRILNKNFEDLEDAEKETLVEFASGIPFVATLMVGNKERGKYHPGSLRPDRVVQRLLGPLYDDPHVRAVIVACSLFSQVGFFDDLADQADIIALQEDICAFPLKDENPEDLPDLRKNKFRQICATLSDHQLLERKGRTYALRPSPLAVRMAEDWWKNCTLTKFNRILPDLTKGRLIESFCLQFRYLKHLEHAQAIVKDLCDGFFSHAEVLNTTVGSRLFRSFVYVNPVACSKALSSAFEKYSIQELSSIIEGRRNLVWALEKLCFRPETFRNSVQVLAAFATGENENLANNATNQFLQLFHVHLPGTAANLDERLQVIEYCLRKDAVYETLGLKAIDSAMKVNQFHRMGGAEDQGDVIALKDYQPSKSEVYSYYKHCVDVLTQYVQTAHPLANTAANILMNHFYAFCSVGIGRLILPAIEVVITSGIEDRMEVRKKINFIIHSKRVYDQLILERLKEMLQNELMPTGFADQFNILVKQPGYEEYYPDGNREDRGNSLAAKIDLLSQEFLSTQEQWNENIQYIITGNIFEAFNFGKVLAKNGTTAQLDVIICEIQNQMKALDPSDRNATVLVGLIANLSDQLQFEEHFHQLIKDEQLKSLAFSIARVKELHFNDLSLLTDLIEKQYFSTNLFSTFIHGWGIQHLKPPQVQELLTRINQVDDTGKAIALMIMVTWSHQKEEVWDTYTVLIRQLISENSSILFKDLHNSMDIHFYGEAVIKLLKGTNDQELAQIIMSFIVEQVNKLENYYSIDNTIYKFLDLLQAEYFSIVWNKIIEVFQNTSQFGMAAWHFKDLIGSHHDAMYMSEGLLFEGNPDKFAQIFKWCESNPEETAILWIAELLPIFNNDRNNADNWHPYAKAFIDAFGENYKVLNSIDAKMGTYSWSGSIVPKLESDKLLFEKLLDHAIPTVREWARIHVDTLEKQIKFEKDKDIDGII